MNNRDYLYLGFRLAAVLLLGMILLGSSNNPPGNTIELARAYTRSIEFDFVGWMLDAFRLKIVQSTLGTSKYMDEEEQQLFVLEYLDLVTRIHQAEDQVELIYADPEIDNPELASAEIRDALDGMYSQRELTGLVTEEILQKQVGLVLGESGLTYAGQPVPPVMYHNTPLPFALIISPRNVIRQDADISLEPELTVQDHSRLEDQIDKGMDVSSLVVPVGGVGVYPTMVQETNNLNWLSEVVSHEWTHNFLSLRPLGMNYFSSPELRTINETTAAIAGKEIGRDVLEKFYPELVPPDAPPPTNQHNQVETANPDPPVFDFRQEMHKTRVSVDEMLARGEIVEAEEYMEQRRKVFWENGYRIRKLNQAYFAFYGAYADQPGGASGAQEDPIGDAVRTLRSQSPTLAAFLNRISWVTSLEKLESIVEEQSG